MRKKKKQISMEANRFKSVEELIKSSRSILGLVSNRRMWIPVKSY